MATRCLLHLNKLSEFKEWLENQGYKILDNTNPFEVLRAEGIKNNKKDVVIIYKKSNAKEHLTVQSKDHSLVKRFIRENSKIKRFNADRLTQRTSAGASLILDNPQNDIEAREQLAVQFKKACEKLANFEDEAEEKEKGCEYCRRNILTVNMKFANNPDVGNPERLNPHRTPNYCPMCGRRLKSEKES